MEWLGPTYIQINLDNIRNNFLEIAKHTTASLCPVLKNDAYGHGTGVTGAFLARLGARYLAVSELAESLELRRAGVEIPILLLTPPATPQIPQLARHRITATVGSPHILPSLAREGFSRQRVIPIHLKIDTGMGRVGVRPEDALEVINKIADYPYLKLTGVYTHFAAAFSDAGYTKRQLEIFLAIKKKVEKQGYNLLWHCANSSAFITLPESHLNMVRVGTLLYGQSPMDLPADWTLHPTWRLISRFVQIKTIHKGETIGYDRAFKAKREMVIGVLPVGYGHGLGLLPLQRNKVHSFKQWAAQIVDGPYKVRIGGQYHPIVGKIAMGYCCVDLTAHHNPYSLLEKEAEIPTRRTTVDVGIPKGYWLYDQIVGATWNQRWYQPIERQGEIYLKNTTNLNFA